MTDKPQNMYCIHCGKEIPANVQFCPYCGANQAGVQADDPTNPASTTVTPEQQPQPERPQKVNMLTAFQQGLVDMFTIGKRTSRAGFWWLYLDIFLIGLVLEFLLSPLLKQLAFSGDFVWVFLLFLLSIPYAMTTVGLFTAEIRRLHDTNRSGHFLWLLLIPLVGPIIVIVLLAQKANPAGQRFDKASQHKSWIKQWWTWVILALVAVATTALFNFSAPFMDPNTLAQSDTTTQTKDDGNAQAEDTDTTDDDAADDTANESSDTDTIDLGDDSIDIADKQNYTTTFSETWSESTFAIDKVTVYKTDGEYTQGSGHDKSSFNGIVKVHMNIDAGRDINAYPTQATLSTNDGQQVDADLSDSDDFDGELDSGTQSDGYIYFLLPKLKDVSDLSSIRLKWSADYDTDDYDDDDAYKDFDVTVQLNQ